jgi:chromosome segregation ATPase
LSESAIATINAWLQKGKEYEEIPDVTISPKKEGVPKTVEIEFLQKENYSLRQQLIALQTALEDYQRQMTSSAYRITELEQLVAREQFSNSQLQDTVASANLRISILNDEISSLSAKWEKERSSIVSDMIITVKEKEKDILELTLDKDNLKDKLAKCTVSCIRCSYFFTELKNYVG